MCKTVYNIVALSEALSLLEMDFSWPSMWIYNLLKLRKFNNCIGEIARLEFENMSAKNVASGTEIFCGASI